MLDNVLHYVCPPSTQHTDLYERIAHNAVRSNLRDMRAKSESVAAMLIPTVRGLYPMSKSIRVQTLAQEGGHYEALCHGVSTELHPYVNRSSSYSRKA